MIRGELKRRSRDHAYDWEPFYYGSKKTKKNKNRAIRRILKQRDKVFKLDKDNQDESRRNR